MSYTFSRRDFMKYSAVAAVAVAGSSMFTGCGSISNPNRPSATYDAAHDSELSFGGKSGGVLGFGGTADSQTLLAGATYDKEDTKTLILPFKHVAVSQGVSCKGYSYQIDIVDNDDKYKSYTDGSDCGSTKVSISDAGGCTGMEPLKEYKPTITVKNIDFTGVKKVAVRYFPRHNALGAQNDAYSDVYATWDITSLFNPAT